MPITFVFTKRTNKRLWDSTAGNQTWSLNSWRTTLWLVCLETCLTCLVSNVGFRFVMGFWFVLFRRAAGENFYNRIIIKLEENHQNQRKGGLISVIPARREKKIQLNYNKSRRTWKEISERSFKPDWTRLKLD